MISSQNRVFLWMGIAIALTWLLLVAWDPNVRGGILESISIVIVFGSLFANTSVAAAWAAFGPGRLLWRVPLSLLWIAFLTSAVGVNFIIRRSPPASIAFIYGALLSVQWGLLQLPLWGLVISQGVHLRHTDATKQGMDLSERQFGLRQLIIITAAIGVLLGIGRLVAPYFAEQFWIARREQIIVIFLGIAEVILTLPLLIAGLLKRRSVLAVSLAILVIGLATVWEHQLLVQVDGPGSAGAGPHTFIAINAGTSVMLLMLLAIVRLNGYSLAISRGQRPTVAG